MSSEATARMVEEAKLVLKRGCPNDENHFMRVEIAPNETCCKVWCPDCGWERVITREEEVPPASEKRVVPMCANCSVKPAAAGLEFRDVGFCCASCRMAYMEKLLTEGGI